MSIERPAVMPQQSRSRHHMVPRIDLGRGVRARHIKDRALRAEIGKFDAAQWDARTRPLGESRDEVMHPVTSLVRRPDDMIAPSRDVDTAIDLVDHAIVALRKKYPAPK